MGVLTPPLFYSFAEPNQILIFFFSFENVSAPFDINEYNTVWKKPSYTPWDFDTYKDFSISNDHNSSCVLPHFRWENST